MILVVGLIAIVVAVVAVAAGNPASRTRIVDGWLIGPDRSCADLSLVQDRCDYFVQRALSYAQDAGGPVASWTLHETRKVSADGSPQLITLGSGVPDGVLLVRHADGSDQVALMGCFQPRGVGSPTEPSCP